MGAPSSDAEAGALGAVPAPSASASASAAGAASLPPPMPPADPKNKQKPVSDEPELQARAKALFEAIVRDDPASAEPLWFPREPFLVLKDIKDPGKYWDQLHRTYAKDVHALHEKRSSWDGARFVRFELGSTPKWVAPGEEGNSIGYFRSFRGKLVFAQNGKEEDLEVRVMITWQGRWFITHLSKFK